jgi:hypothetical protein
VIRLDAATVLLQWATGGMAFCWFTTRRRQVGTGYGWLLRVIYGLLALGGLVVGLRYGVVPVREVALGGVIVACAAALVVSIARRRLDPGATGGFPPLLDLVPVVIGAVGLVAAAVDAADGAGDVSVSLLRTLAGAAFLGCVTDAMLLGHWYLVQPGLPRKLLNEMVTALGWVWPIEVASLLLPTGMLSVWSGAVDDGWNGTLGWFWGACAATTIVLVFVTRAALKERQYSAVMAATGLLYLAILTAFGTDLVARAVLDG